MIYKGHQIMEQCTVWPKVGESYFVIRNEETKKYVRDVRKNRMAGFKTEGAAKQHIDNIEQGGDK